MRSRADCGTQIAAAKSLQSCPTLCDPTDVSPSGSAIPGILQARILEWGAKLLIAKFRLKLKKAGKTTRPLRYELDQIPYSDYTVKVTNRFKGFDLIDRIPEELWMEVHDIVQEAVMKTIPKKRK